MCLAPWDVLNYEAVRTIHSQLDDDHNGDIDVAESVDVWVLKGFFKNISTAWSTDHIY